MDNQGFPDLTLLYGNKFAILECKKSEKEYKAEQEKSEDLKNAREFNQAFYIDKFASQAYASFIYPENMQDVISDLDNYFR